MFDIRTCPDCDGVLAPGAERCSTCSDPGPEVADPWSLGTDEAVEAARAEPVPPAAGSQLATKPRPATRQGLSTGAKIAIGVVVGLVVVGVVAAVGLFALGSFLAGEAEDAFVEGFADELEATEGLDQFEFEPSYTVTGFSVGECYSLDETDRPVAAACTDGHYYEVYHQLEAGGSEYPESFDYDEACWTAFESFVGIDYWESAYFSDTILPSEADWEAGERTVSCVLHEPFTELTGSARGTAR